MFNELEFKFLNNAYNTTFKPQKLSFGLVSPIENYQIGFIPTMDRDLEYIKLAEALGFKAIWLRDIPFNVPSFGDVGQMYDPFVYLGYLAANTSKIALGIGSLILPLRHPAHVAKAAASVDFISKGRLLLGIASGDRYEEYPAMNIEYDNRGEKFQESFEYISKMRETNPSFSSSLGVLDGTLDMLPKPYNEKFPLLITGASQQNPTWVATYTDGWITYPRDAGLQSKVIQRWRGIIKDHNISNKPISQSLYIDLVNQSDAMPSRIHLGYRTGTKFLLQHLKDLEAIGVNHVAFNLRFNTQNIESTLKILSDEIISQF